MRERSLRNTCVRTARVFAELGRKTEGQDLIEYALLTGLIAIAGILLFPTIQSRMPDAYQDSTDNAYAISETPPPL